jgi:APA family basic amino acid/polyamine antiporter
MTDKPSPPTLLRVLGLPMLVFYGVGVTIGAGIFALIGEIVRVAGDHAPMAFLLAGLIAGATGFSYALLVIALTASPLLADRALLLRVATAPVDAVAWAAVFSASIIAFFAFVGFEDLENMAEETIDPKKVMPKAILLTLLITVILYAVISTIAVALPDRDALTRSSAPLAMLFESVTGWSGKPIAAMAAVAMVNGILIQIVMASRVIYGMANEGLVPAWLGKIDARRRTPVRAIALVTVAIALLALGLPLVHLAQATSVVTLAVFTLVNLALWRIGSRDNAAPTLRRWRHWGVVGALMAAGLLATEILRLAF